MSNILKVRGVGRYEPSQKILVVHFNHKPTDDEMREFHDWVSDFRLAKDSKPRDAKVLNSVYEDLHAELRHTRKFCRECGGSGKATSWDVNGGPPLVKCQCRCVPDTGTEYGR